MEVRSEIVKFIDTKPERVTETEDPCPQPEKIYILI